MRAAPLIALLVVARSATAGMCWSSMGRSGRCSSVLAQRVARDACCSGAAPAAWSEPDLDSGALFFWVTLGGGVPCKACSESCASVTCGAGKTCVVREGRARCVCSSRCARSGPVCGSDGRTYKSLCRLRRRACRRPSRHISLDYPGHCKENTCAGVRCSGDKRCVLDAELAAHCVRCSRCSPAGDTPLCAADGRTYAGACALRRAACERGRALPLAYRGPCRSNATCASVACPGGQRCVRGGPSGVRCVSCACARRGRRLCGADGRTYASWCELQRRACDTGLLLQPAHAGPCRRNETTMNNSEVRLIGEDVINAV